MHSYTHTSCVGIICYIYNPSTTLLVHVYLELKLWYFCFGSSTYLVVFQVSNPLPFRGILYLHNLAKSVNLYGILHHKETLIKTFQPALVFTAVSDRCQLGSDFGWTQKLIGQRKSYINLNHQGIQNIYLNIRHKSF